MTERIDCAHCKQTGTCSNGPEGVACAVCSRHGRRVLDYSSAPKGLVCCICEGKGSIEPFTLKLQNRFLPFFAMIFVIVLLAFVISAYFIRGDVGFDKLIGFAGTLIGSITGYYFGGKNIDVSTASKTAETPSKTPEPPR